MIIDLDSLSQNLSKEPKIIPKSSKMRPYGSLKIRKGGYEIRSSSLEIVNFCFSCDLHFPSFRANQLTNFDSTWLIWKKK